VEAETLIVLELDILAMVQELAIIIQLVAVAPVHTIREFLLQVRLCLADQAAVALQMRQVREWLVLATMAD
jgi:hypothetical protein